MDGGRADWQAVAHAETLLDLRRDAEAEQRFRDVLAGDPTSGRALLGLARALNRQDRHAEAEAAVRSALALDPENGEALADEEPLAPRREFTDPDEWRTAAESLRRSLLTT